MHFFAYVLHYATVLSGELALAKAASEGTVASYNARALARISSIMHLTNMPFLMKNTSLLYICMHIRAQICAIHIFVLILCRFIGEY